MLQASRQTCHRPSGLNLSGMVAPMSLITYEEVCPWAKVVEAKTMPPWHASAATHGVFRNERTLTDTQIATITQWVATGAGHVYRGRSPDVAGKLPRVPPAFGR